MTDVCSVAFCGQPATATASRNQVDMVVCTRHARALERYGDPVCFDRASDVYVRTLASQFETTTQTMRTLFLRLTPAERDALVRVQVLGERVHPYSLTGSLVRQASSRVGEFLARRVMTDQVAV